MANTYTDLLRMTLQTDESNNNIWGDIYNRGVTDLIEEAITGRVSIDLTTSNKELDVVNGGNDEARAMFIYATGLPSVARQLIVPSAKQKLYVVVNQTGQNLEVKTASNTGITLAPTEKLLLGVDETTDTVFSVGIVGDLVTEAPAFTNAAGTIVNATAGDTAVTFQYALQGALAIVRFEALSTTTSGTTFGLNWTAGVPAAIIPSAVSPDYLVYVVEAGVIEHCWMSIPNSDANWTFHRGDGAAWTNGSTKIINHNINVIYPVLAD